MRAYPVLHPIWQKHFLKLLLLGIIESELVAIPAMQKRLEKEYQQPISGQLLLKKKIAICPFPAP